MILNNVGIHAVNVKTREVEVVGINGIEGEDTTRAELEEAYARLKANPDNVVTTLILWEDQMQLSVWETLDEVFGELHLDEEEDDEEEDDA